MGSQEPTINPTVPVSQSPLSTQSPQKNNPLTIISFALFILFSLGVVAFLYYQNQQLKEMLVNYQTQTPSPTPIVTKFETASPSASPKKAAPRVCTQEAKLCPDGSSVGRTGPSCEFAPCP